MYQPMLFYIKQEKQSIVIHVSNLRDTSWDAYPQLYIDTFSTPICISLQIYLLHLSIQLASDNHGWEIPSKKGGLELGKSSNRNRDLSNEPWLPKGSQSIQSTHNNQRFYGLRMSFRSGELWSLNRRIEHSRDGMRVWLKSQPKWGYNKSSTANRSPMNWTTAINSLKYRKRMRLKLGRTLNIGHCKNEEEPLDLMLHGVALALLTLPLLGWVE